jgi:hypothetical protein
MAGKANPAADAELRFSARSKVDDRRIGAANARNNRFEDIRTKKVCL